MSISGSELSNLVDQVMAHVDTVSGELVRQVEAIKPGNRFGREKELHCQKLASEAESLGELFGFDAIETLLLKVTLRVHDLGRHIEAIQDKDTTRDGVRHGMLSVEVLQRECALAPLPTDMQQVILDATFYHAEREVLLEEGSLGWRIACAARDLDQSEGLTAVHYLTPSGVLVQIDMHYLRHWLTSELLEHAKEPQLKSELERMIANYLDGREEKEFSTRTRYDAAVKSRVRGILTGRVPSHMLDQFCQRKMLPVQEVTHSYAAYMLWLLSWYFNIRNAVLRDGSWEHPEFVRKVSFVQRHTTAEEFQRICDALGMR